MGSRRTRATVQINTSKPLINVICIMIVARIARACVSKHFNESEKKFYEMIHTQLTRRTKCSLFFSSSRSVFFGLHFATQVTKSACICWTCLWSNIPLDFMRHFDSLKYVRPMDKINGIIRLIPGIGEWSNNKHERQRVDMTKKTKWWNIWSRATPRCILYNSLSAVCSFVDTQRYMLDVVAGNLHIHSLAHTVGYELDQMYTFGIIFFFRRSICQL